MKMILMQFPIACHTSELCLFDRVPPNGGSSMVLGLTDAGIIRIFALISTRKPVHPARHVNILTPRTILLKMGVIIIFVIIVLGILITMDYFVVIIRHPMSAHQNSLPAYFWGSVLPTPRKSHSTSSLSIFSAAFLVRHIHMQSSLLTTTDLTL
jgi:hypothetical protein